MSERVRRWVGPLSAAGLALASVAAFSFPVALTAVGVTAFVLGLRIRSGALVPLVAGVSLAAGGAAAVVGGTPVPLSVLIGSAGALTVALSLALARHLDARAKYREAGWRLAWALDARRRAVDAEARESERVRIAAEMHDSLGHDMALIAVRASALEAKASASPRAGSLGSDLAELRTAAADATDRLHRIVTLLSTEEGPHRTARVPQESLDGLVHEAAAAGMVVRVDIDPSWDDDDDPSRVLTRRTVHRLVEESLTNAAKHAPGAAVDVSLRQQEGAVRVTLRNALTAEEPHHADASIAASGGRGLHALSERVRVLGGRLEWHVADGRFEVAAVMPVDGAPSADAEAVPLDGDVDPEVYRSHALRHRRRSRTALVLATGGVLVGALSMVAAVFTFTTVASVLPADRFARISAGQDRADAERLLPPVEMSDAPVVDEPARDCRYYEAHVSFFERVDVFQVCFTDGSVARTAVVPAEGD